MLKICAYARVSTDSRDQANSFESQQTYFEREIKNKPDCKFMGIYADKGLTGTNLYKRPEFNKMMYDAGLDLINTSPNPKDRRVKMKSHKFVLTDRQPKFDYIYMKNTSRFARNTLSSELVTLLRQKGVYIYFLEQNIDTKELTQDFMLGLFSLFDQQDSRDKSIKVRTGVNEAIQRNRVHSNGKLYGYKYDIPTKTLSIIEDEAKVVRKIFELYSSGLGIRRVIKYLTDNKIYTRQGKPFLNSTIKNMLINEKYAGFNNRGKHDTGVIFVDKNAYPKVKNKTEYTIQKNDNIPAIVEEEIFWKCQELLKSKAENQKGVYHGCTQYVGLLYCGQCGKPYNSNKDVDRHFYNCSTKKRYGVTACNNPNVSLKKIEEYIEELCNGEYKRFQDLYISLSSFILEEIKKKLTDKLDVSTMDLINEKNAELDKIKIGLDRLLDLYTDGEIDKEIYETKKTKLKEKQSTIELDILTLGNKDVDISKDIKNIEYIQELTKKISEADIDFRYTKEMLLELIVKIEVGKDGKLFFVNDLMVSIKKMIWKYGMKEIEMGNVM